MVPPPQLTQPSCTSIKSTVFEVKCKGSGDM